MTRILSVASEIFPLVKTGGLADVVGALPAALVPHGVETRTLVPGYPAILSALADAREVRRIADLFGGPATVIAGEASGLSLYALDAPHLYARPGNPYLGADGKDWPDNWQRFAALSMVANDIARGALPDFVPDVMHAHDWQAALAAVYLKTGEAARVPSVVTIHNLAFQGNFAAAIFPRLKLPLSAFAIHGIEYYGGVSFLKGGLQMADAITTVSPTYAEEICTPAGGMGLDGLLRSRRESLTGICNGIDVRIWNPETDPLVPTTYSTRRLHARPINKREVESRFGLDAEDGPIFCVVSRLAWQKGMDILAACLDDLVAAGGRLAVLGSGEAALENLFHVAASRHAGRVGIVTGYHEPLAHLLHAGADAIIVPSRFEPCGLTQFHGLRYGCVPIVSRVGGLADTIIDANDAALTAGVATGLQFLPVDANGLASALSRALRLYADVPTWRAMQRRGMHADVTWNRSALRYAALYRSLLGREG